MSKYVGLRRRVSTDHLSLPISGSSGNPEMAEDGVRGFSRRTCPVSSECISTVTDSKGMRGTIDSECLHFLWTIGLACCVVFPGATCGIVENHLDYFLTRANYASI
jgi:hypothetical protein